MPAARLWRRVINHNEKATERAKEEWRKEAFKLFTLSRAVSYALTSNRDLPPTKKEANQKKPNWTKIHESRAELEQFQKNHAQGHRNVYEFCQFMGVPNFFEKPPEPEVPKPKTLGDFANTKEGRAERKKAVNAMQDRIIEKLKRLEDATGNEEFGATAERQEREESGSGRELPTDKPVGVGTRAEAFAEDQGLNK